MVVSINSSGKGIIDSNTFLPSDEPLEMKIVESFAKYFGVKQINMMYSFYGEMTFGILPGSNEHLVFSLLVDWTE